MPIYAYKCNACGFAKDVLQKLSDAPLSDCPSCGAATFAKQLTAAGFQLKGSGWYATDFKGGNQGATAAGQGKEGDGKDAKAGDGNPDAKADGKGDVKAATPAAESTASKPDAAPAASTGA